MSGQDLFEALVKNSGLPEDYVRSRLADLIEKSGGTAESLQMDQVRELLSDLLLQLIEDSDLDTHLNPN